MILTCGRMEIRKDRDRDGPHRGDGEERHPPVRHVLRKKRHPVTGTNRILREKVLDLADTRQQLRVCHRLPADHGEGCGARKLLRALLKDVPERCRICSHTDDLTAIDVGKRIGILKEPLNTLEYRILSKGSRP